MTLRDQCVEAAARAVHDLNYGLSDWADHGPETAEEFLRDAATAFEAIFETLQSEGMRSCAITTDELWNELYGSPVTLRDQCVERSNE